MKLVAAAHDRGLQVRVFTLNQDWEFDLMRRLGVEMRELAKGAESVRTYGDVCRRVDDGAPSQAQHLQLARGQASDPRPRLRRLVLKLRSPRMLRQRLLHGIQEHGLVHRFGEELEGALLHGLHRHGDVAVARHQDDRRSEAILAELLHQFEAGEARHAHVEDQATGHVGELRIEELLRRMVGLGLDADRPRAQRPHRRARQSPVFVRALFDLRSSFVHQAGWNVTRLFGESRIR